MTDSYFKAKLIAENIYHISEPGGVNTSLIIGQEKALLIDTGYGFGDLASFIKTLTDKPVQVLVTHGHTDHCGGNYQFPNVYMNMADIPTYLWYASTQREMIVDKFKRDRAASGLPDVWPENFDREKYLATHNNHFSELEDGQIFDLGGRKEHVIFLPGHTMGSVMVYDDLTGLLFAGDDIGPSLWIFFDTSASLSSYAMKLMYLTTKPFKGIVYSHSQDIYPKGIMNDLLTTISRIDLENDRVFIHPRTGQKAHMHKEPCTSVENVKYVYVVYDKNRL